MVTAPIFRKYLIELSGPAGSGKSTLMQHLRTASLARFVYIGRPRPSRLQRLRAALSACPILFWPMSLGLAERRRLFQGHRTLIAARLWIDDLPAGMHLLDEGPFRVMQDFACFSEAQLVLWRRIALSEARKLDGLPVTIARLECPEELRAARRRERMSALEKNDPDFNPALPYRKRRALFFLSSEWPDFIRQLENPPTVCAVKNCYSIEAAAHSLLGCVPSPESPR